MPDQNTPQNSGQNSFVDLIARVEKLETQMMKLLTKSPQIKDDLSSSNQKLQKMQDKFTDQEQKLKELQEENKQLSKQLNEKDISLQQCRSQYADIQKQLGKCEQELSKSCAERDIAQSKFAKLQNEQLKEQAEFFNLQIMLQELSPEIIHLADKYYNVRNLRVFLTQCGHFSLLSQFWETCRSEVLKKGSKILGASDLLLKILQIYNDSAPNSQAVALQAQEGEKYDFDTQQRVGDNIERIKTTLLPGLKNPAGKILHKTLVI